MHGEMISLDRMCSKRRCVMKKIGVIPRRAVEKMMVSAFGMTVGQMAMESGKAFAEARRKAKESASTEAQKKA